MHRDRAVACAARATSSISRRSSKPRRLRRPVSGSVRAASASRSISRSARSFSAPASRPAVMTVPIVSSQRASSSSAGPPASAERDRVGDADEARGGRPRGGRRGRSTPRSRPRRRSSANTARRVLVGDDAERDEQRAEREARRHEHARAAAGPATSMTDAGDDRRPAEERDAGQPRVRARAAGRARRSASSPPARKSTPSERHLTPALGHPLEHGGVRRARRARGCGASRGRADRGSRGTLHSR